MTETEAQNDVEASGRIFDFEATLRAIFTQVGESMPEQFVGLRHALADRMARADEIGATIDTLYTTLVARLRGSGRQGRRLVFVSLNYDCLAEHALNGRQRFSSFADYIENDGWGLFKPHGSCAWRILPADVDRNKWRRSEPRAEMAEEYLALGYAPAESVPALALPMSGDDAGKTAWPASHQDRLLKDIDDVDEAIVVGWRGADYHIVEMVQGHLPMPLRRLHLVGYHEDYIAEMAQNLSTWTNAETELTGVTGGFRAYVDGHSALEKLFPSIVI